MWTSRQPHALENWVRFPGPPPKDRGSMDHPLWAYALMAAKPALIVVLALCVEVRRWRV